ncbi:MAG: alpha/beta hydrolase [Caldilineaceae bacterium]|nr:alpha/beta hydrolase [Caldilineaceae bacterium]
MPMNYQSAVTQMGRLAELNLHITQTGLTTYMRRQLHGPRRGNWPWHFEWMIELMNLRTPSTDDLTAADVRFAMNQAEFGAFPLPPGITVTPVSAGGVPAIWFTHEESRPDQVILYLHGGGYVSGSPFTHRYLISELVRVTGRKVLALDYRLAPEATYPAALEDAWTGYWWLLAHGYDAQQIVVGGDSAGGGLSMALLLALRDAHAPQPAGAFGLSPWLDLTLSGLTISTNRDSDYLNRTILKRSAEFYLGDHSPRDPLASPLFGDLHDLAPIFIQAGTAEMLLDDARRFARHAAATNTHIEFEPWENMVHVWHFLFMIDPQARLAIEHAGRFIREQLIEKE